MKLRSLYLDDTVCIPQSKSVGDGPLHDTRDAAFHVDDGWDIRETLTGVFTITNDAMGERIVTIGGYGYSYEREPEQLASDDGYEEVMMARALQSANGPQAIAAQTQQGRRRRK